MDATADDHKVRLRVDGMDYGGWTSVRIGAGIERQARDFDLSICWNWPGQESPLPIKQGAKAEVLIGADLVLTGWVFATPIRYDANQISRGVRGRSLTADMVDCGALNKPGQWRKQSVQQIVQALAKPFGLEVVSEVPETRALADHSIEPGETAFESVDRLLTISRFMSSDDARGRVVIVKPGSGGTASDKIEVGVNVLEADADLDFSQLMSEYKVVGQQSGTDQSFGQASNEVASTITDARVARYRPLLIQQQGQLNKQQAAERVNWERGSRAGKALTAAYKVQGWRQSSGALWVPNQTVRVVDPVMGFDRDMLIIEVEYQLDAQGTVATLTVAPPEAVMPEPPDPEAKKSKKKSDDKTAKKKRPKKSGKSDNFEYLLPVDWEKK